MPRVKIVQTPGKEVPAEVIASAIVDIGKAMKKLSASRLEREAVVLLIAHDSGVAARNVRNVLMSMDDLETRWLKPKKK